MKKYLMLLFALLITPTVMAENISVTFTWTATGDDGNVGTAAKYDLRMSSQPITEANYAAATIIPSISTKVPLVSGSPETFTTILVLNSETTYHFSLKAGDEAGNWGFVSNDKIYTTPDLIPPGVIIDLDATN
jgi:hypothetical protein